MIRRHETMIFGSVRTVIVARCRMRNSCLPSSSERSSTSLKYCSIVCKKTSQINQAWRTDVSERNWLARRSDFESVACAARRAAHRENSPDQSDCSETEVSRVRNYELKYMYNYIKRRTICGRGAACRSQCDHDTFELFLAPWKYASDFQLLLPAEWNKE